MVRMFILSLVLSCLLASSGSAQGTDASVSAAERAFSEGVEAMGAFGMPNYATARARYGDACEGGVGQGCLNAAWLEREGLGGAADLLKARELYESACKLGIDAGCKAATQIIPAGNGNSRLVSVMPETCWGLYLGLSSTPRAPEVIAEYDVINQQLRARTMRERDDFIPLEPFSTRPIARLAFNSPMLDAQVVEEIAACDRAHGLNPVATHGAREALISDKTCATSFLIYTGLGRPADETAQWQHYAEYALGQHLTAIGALGPDGMAPPAQVAEISAAANARFARINQRLETIEGLQADSNACVAKYTAKSAGAP